MEEKNRVRLLRERTGLNRKEFSERFEIPYRTVTDWELGHRHAPEYVIRLLEYYVRLAEPGLCGRPVEESVKEHYITTYTGQRFYPTNPQAEAVHVEDILVRGGALPVLREGGEGQRTVHAGGAGMPAARRGGVLSLGYSEAFQGGASGLPGERGAADLDDL